MRETWSVYLVLLVSYGPNIRLIACVLSFEDGQTGNAIAEPRARLVGGPLLTAYPRLFGL